MWINLDELYPPRATLVGMQFENDADFDRCLDLLSDHLECYDEVYLNEKMVVVRKTDTHIFAEAG